MLNQARMARQHGNERCWALPAQSESSTLCGIVGDMSIRARLIFGFGAVLALFGANFALSKWIQHSLDTQIGEFETAFFLRYRVSAVDQHGRQLFKIADGLRADARGNVAIPPGQRLAITPLLNELTDETEALRRSLNHERDVRAARYPHDREQAPADWAYQPVVTFCASAEAAVAAWRDFLAHPANDPLTRLHNAHKQTNALSNLAYRARYTNVADSAALDLSDNVYRLKLYGAVAPALLIISWCVATLVIFLVCRSILVSVQELNRSASRIAGGDFNHRASVGLPVELARVASQFNSMAAQLGSMTGELKKQQELAESLLLNVLPAEVAEELKQKGAVTPQYHEDVTILFTDFKGFTASTEKLAAEELVALLHDYFTAFDRITERYGLEKLKTIGDSYMAVAGLPERKPSHAVDAVLAAFEMVDEVVVRQGRAGPAWSVRVGVHTGPVISGVVGVRKFAFDVWGESVNFASRLESSGAPNRINLSAIAYQRVKDFFMCEKRGRIATREGREFEMYFAVAALATLLDGNNPPGPFAARYQTYFKRQLPAFPASLLGVSRDPSSSTPHSTPI